MERLKPKTSVLKPIIPLVHSSIKTYVCAEYDDNYEDSDDNDEQDMDEDDGVSTSRKRKKVDDEDEEEVEDEEIDYDEYDGLSMDVMDIYEPKIEDTFHNLAQHWLYPAKIKIAGSNTIIPGDFISHAEYGIGQYLGYRKIFVHPLPKLQAKSVMVDVMDILYSDAIVTWYVRLAQQDIWKYQSGELNGKVELSSIIDPTSWIAKKRVAKLEAEKLASDLIYLNCLRNTLHRPPCIANNQQYEDFLARFPYTPTVDQVACFEAVERDMCYSTRPMDRLIAGDVGFGKTEVAMRAIYRAVISKKQVALLAPTLVLAQQHMKTLQKRMPDVNVQLLVGGDATQSARVKADILSGKCQVVVATHALLQPSVKFHNLGLLVIDEEHKFGVDQKEVVQTLNQGIDILTLSATPLPRTLQIASQKLKEISQMNVAPEGRKPVKTFLEVNDTEIIKEAIIREVDRGGQVYIIVPFISMMSAVMTMLNETVPNMTVIQAHGQHKDLGQRIVQFSKGEVNILVSTTVVENGVNVPNANTILIFHADLFGMSALYQLRGRVGRSSLQAYCYFFTPPGRIITRRSRQRLDHLMEYTNLGSGYALALEDKKIRGAGSLFGKEQSGIRSIGEDLQSHYLVEAHKQIRTELVLSVPHTQLELNSEIEFKWMDHKWTKMNNTLQVEIHMASEIISSHLDSLIRDSDEEGKEDLMHKRDEMMSQYMTATTTEKLKRCAENWKSQLNVTELPNSLSDLICRTRLQTAAKGIGVHEVISTICQTEDAEPYLKVELKTREISSLKWKNLFADLIPQESKKIFDIFHEVSYNQDNEEKRESQILVLFKKTFKHEKLRESHSDLMVLTELFESFARHVVELLEMKLTKPKEEKVSTESSTAIENTTQDTINAKTDYTVEEVTKSEYLTK